MPGFQGERHQQKRANKSPQSLHDYWQRPHVITPSLWGETILPEVQKGSTSRLERIQREPGRSRRSGNANQTIGQGYERERHESTQELRERIQYYGVTT